MPQAPVTDVGRPNESHDQQVVAEDRHVHEGRDQSSAGRRFRQDQALHSVDVELRPHEKDIGDLLTTEVDWKEGRVIRKRSKTADCENVPTVNYLLWPETFRLLKQERAVDSEDLVLRNANGNPIWSEEITKEGKYKKNDNIKNAFDRLRKELGIAKPLKSLKKTSASLLRDNEKFSALASLFLGHAPQSMSDRHYTQFPQNLFDQAVTWLGQEFGIIAPTVVAKPDEAAAKPSDSVPATEADGGEQAPAPKRRSNTRSRRAGRTKAARTRPAASRRVKDVPGV